VARALTKAGDAHAKITRRRQCCRRVKRMSRKGTGQRSAQPSSRRGCRRLSSLMIASAALEKEDQVERLLQAMKNRARFERMKRVFSGQDGSQRQRMAPHSGHPAALFCRVLRRSRRGRQARRRPAPAVEQSMFRLINQERVQRELPALKWSDKLQQAARKHSELMVHTKRLSHRFPDEGDLMSRSRRHWLAFQLCCGKPRLLDRG